MPQLTLSVTQRRLLAALALALVAGVLVLRQHGGGAAATPLAGGAGPAAARLRGRAARPIVVDVVGAVREPGLYHLADGARVADAVAQAGGLSRRADRSAVNLAARVADGQQVVVAARGSPGAAAAAGSGAGRRPARPSRSARRRVEQLDTLPGIGPVTAEKIVAFRQEHGPFTSVEGLDAIPGIGPARLARAQGAGRPVRPRAPRRAGAGRCGCRARCSRRRPPGAARARAAGGCARARCRRACSYRRPFGDSRSSSPRSGCSAGRGEACAWPRSTAARCCRPSARRGGCASSSPARRESGGSASVSLPASFASTGVLCTSACSSSSRPAAPRRRARS